MIQRSGIRIILDRSALHGDRFDQIFAHPLQVATERNLVTLCYTPVFISETLRMWQNPANRTELERQIKKIVSTPALWLRGTRDVWRYELIRNARHHATAAMSPRETAIAKDDLSGKGAVGAIFKAAASALDAEAERKAELQASRSHIRQKIASSPLIRRAGAEDGFDCFEREVFDEVGRAFIRKFFPPHLHSELTRRWTRSPTDYRYFTGYLRGFLYDAYYAIAELNRRLDKNAMADCEHLVFLNEADIMVSADERFFASAFSRLWAQHGKQLWSPQRLVQFLGTLMN